MIRDLYYLRLIIDPPCLAPRQQSIAFQDVLYVQLRLTFPFEISDHIFVVQHSPV